MHIIKFLAAALLSLLATAASAQQSGGILRISHRDSPGSMSMHEEGTNSVSTVMMAVFNNLVIYDQHKPQNTMDTIRPELGKSWTWSDDRTRLSFTLQQNVRWHDGKPFTSKDVVCTWNLLMGKATEKFRLNFREGWYKNLAEVTASGDYEVTFHLKRPQPSFITFLASGFTPVYPCHVPPNVMRSKPIGTGPFKFVEFKANDSIKLTRNNDYWKLGLPYLDGIEFTIIPNRSTAFLAFAADKFDVTFPYEVSIPLLKDVKSSAPQAVCEVAGTNVASNILVNSNIAPFDNPKIRRAMALTLDRKSFVDILTEGQGTIGGAMLPAPEGVWGLPPEILKTIPGYGPDVENSRAEGRKLMESLGYGPDKRLAIKVSTRNIPSYRDPAVILIDQLKHVYIDGELDVIDTSIWHAKVTRRDFVIAANLTGSGLDDPDQQFYENYACGAQRNYTNYCNKEIDALIDKQSVELDPAKRRDMVWEIDRRLQEDAARPIISHGRGGTCWQPRVRNLSMMVNSIYNGFRFEDVWLAK